MLKKINYKEAIIYNNETTFHNKITNNIRNFEGKYTWLKRYKLIKLTFRLYMVQMKKVGGTYIVDYPD